MTINAAGSSCENVTAARSDVPVRGVMILVILRPDGAFWSSAVRKLRSVFLAENRKYSRWRCQLDHSGRLPDWSLSTSDADTSTWVRIASSAAGANTSGSMIVALMIWWSILSAIRCFGRNLADASLHFSHGHAS